MLFAIQVSSQLASEGGGDVQRATGRDHRDEHSEDRRRRQDQGPGRLGNRRRADDRAQDSYLHTLARKAGEEVGDDLTKAEASIKIDELRDKTGIADPKPKKRKKAK